MKDNWRMEYHIMPPMGWMNDPNGLCQMNGVYHVFFQYAPNYLIGEKKGWGHYTSKDLLKWKFEGTPIKPDTSLDRDGAYSGCALIDEETMYLYYTGNVKEKGDYDYITAGRGNATLLVTSPDGIHFSQKQCILDKKDYPDNYSCHIRDPKVWKEEDHFYMVIGGRTKKSEGRVLLYTSTDKLRWEYVRELMTSQPFGYMWECPDYFVMDGIGFLSVCPQGLEEETFRYQNVYQSGYFIMNSADIKENEPVRFHEWDHGFDFYAPQTFEDEKGRRILLGWAGMPDEEAHRNPSEARGWVHSMTMFREVTVKNGRLFTFPIREYEQCRGQEYRIDGQNSVEISLSAEMIINNPKNNDINVSLNEDFVVQYEVRKEEFSIQFGKSLGCGRTTRKMKLKNCKELHIYVDHSIAEIYINHGEAVFTTRFYPTTDSLMAKSVGQDQQCRCWGWNPVKEIQ